MKQLMSGAQTAAKWTMQAGQRMKEAARIKPAFIRRKEIEQRETSHDYKPENEPVHQTCIHFHPVHAVSCAEASENGQARELQTAFNFQKKLASHFQPPNIAPLFAVRRFA